MSRKPTFEGRRLSWACGLAAALACASLASVITASSKNTADNESALRLGIDGRSLKIFDGAKSLAEYRYVSSPTKAYMKQWRTPSGVNVLRDSPHDHVHHHALMYAIGVDGVDFWGEQKGAGRQVHRSLDGVKAYVDGGVAVAAFTQRLDWMAPGEKSPRLREARTIEAYRGQGLGASLLSWSARFEPGAGRGAVQLEGAHYFGLGMRFVTSMDKGGRFVHPGSEAGDAVRGTEKVVRSKWCAYTARVDGKPVTVAMFDHPTNVRHPAAWFTMTAPFAYMSATLNLHREKMRLKAGETLDLRYGVALWDGEASSARIEELYGAWLKLVSTKKIALSPRP